MSDEVGPVYLAGEQEVFIGKSWGQQRNYSEDVAARVDTEIRRIMEEQSARATKVLDDNREAVERVVKVLLEREQLTGDEFIKVFNGEELDASESPERLITPDDVPENSEKTGDTEAPSNSDEAK